MISFEEAYQIVMRQARVLESEAVALREASGRVLAADVACDVDMPPFDKSAMDGYACRRGDLPGPLRVVETIQAGTQPRLDINAGECAKIMTGAMVPRGADCVVMVEHSAVEPDGRISFTGTATQTNICRRGEDVQRGDTVLRTGTLLHPQHLAVLAAAGCALPQVARRPRVGVIATGDELVEPDRVPGPSQIRNSNSTQLCAQLEQAGAIATYHGIVEDEESALDAIMKRAMAENDVVIFSGGVSMGDYDFVPDIMKQNGIEILFDAIAMKPGKPTTFGVGPSCYCFGLPGNPVSSFLQCELLVKPLLYALMGHQYCARHSCMSLAVSYTRKRADREARIPVVLNDDNTVTPTTYHGSAHIHALVGVVGFITIPAHVRQLASGTPVTIHLL